jgi:hypothetical protein
MAKALEEVLRGKVANWAMRSLVRDITRELKDLGKRPPAFARDVLEALAEAAGEQIPDSIAASGSAVESVVLASWISVSDAAARNGLSERRIRQLAETGRVRAQKVGTTWQIDLDSLTNVLRRAA